MATRNNKGLKRDPQVVVRSENRIRFIGRVNALAHRQYLHQVTQARERGYDEVILDFGPCEGVFPIGMVPLIASVDAFRRDGVNTKLVLPASDYLKRLFHNANWAHLIEPDSYTGFDIHHRLHVAAHRFVKPSEQQDLVNACMDVVMRQMNLPRAVISALEWSINEITDNVLTHAQSPDGGIVQVNTLRNSRKVTFAVADSGRGILSTLSEGHPQLRSDAEAIEEALKAGVTRNPEIGQGNGLAGSLRIATMSGGSMEIASGRAELLVRRGADARTQQYRESMRVPGTVVYVELGLGQNLLEGALGFAGTAHLPIDIIETAHLTERGDATVLRLRDESSGFGSRLLGRQIRQKCTNLLNAEPTKPLILDWTGVSIISSSFADELIGKLFVELGPLAFAARVQNRGMEGLVRSLIDRAIMQRAAQATQGNRMDE